MPLGGGRRLVFHGSIAHTGSLVHYEQRMCTDGASLCRWLSYSPPSRTGFSLLAAFRL